MALAVTEAPKQLRWEECPSCGLRKKVHKGRTLTQPQISHQISWYMLPTMLSTMRKLSRHWASVSTLTGTCLRVEGCCRYVLTSSTWLFPSLTRSHSNISVSCRNHCHHYSSCDSLPCYLYFAHMI
ncbi:hypothetical protein E2C01_024863 [Portunus trituberculatus]|uniref:Uncharacterized protein n=1 Tax=Portunus trituberculatus TaxID=210409 RepID=A0A5B7EBD8_PORTR|nr:hypothetical protein [Portunus trituberculatus]